jgi:hypothetical protein
MLTQPYRMVKKSLAMRGVAGTVAYAMKWPLVIYNERRSLVERNAIQSDFDRRHGTDTGGIIPLSSFTITSSNWVHGVRYAPTSPQGFRKALSMLGLDAENFHDFTFVDIGAGKGATLLYAAELGFKSVVGVEFVEGLHEVAVRNIAAFAPARSIGESVCIDAVQYPMPDTPLVVFMNYPFSSKQLMGSVIANMQKSSGGPKYLIALNFPYDPADLPGTRVCLIQSSSNLDGRLNYAFEVQTD